MASCLREAPNAGGAEGDEDAQSTPGRAPSGTQMPLGRVATGLGWVALGALAVGTAARALLRSGRSPSTDDEPGGQEPDGQEPDVLLDVSELEVDRIRSEEHTSELQSRQYLVCRLL